MSQITSQRKQRALIRVAESRIEALDAVTASKEHAALCVKALPVSPSVLKYAGVAAGAAASVTGVFAGLRRKKNAAAKAAAKGTTFYPFVLNTLLPLLLPMLQRFIYKGVAGHSSCSPGKRADF